MSPAMYRHERHYLRVIQKCPRCGKRGALWAIVNIHKNTGNRCGPYFVVRHDRRVYDAGRHEINKQVYAAGLARKKLPETKNLYVKPCFLGKSTGV